MNHELHPIPVYKSHWDMSPNRSVTLWQLASAIKQFVPPPGLEKKDRPVVTVGTPVARSTLVSKLTRFNPLYQLDADGKDNPAFTVEAMVDALWGLESVALVATSPSGNGVKAIFHGPTAESPAHYRAIHAELREFVLMVTGISLDPKTGSPKSLMYLPNDPFVRHRDAPRWDQEVPVPVIPDQSGFEVTDWDALSITDLTPIEQIDEVNWFVECPGKFLHTGPDQDSDCRLSLDGTPTLHCFHSSCKELVDGWNQHIRESARAVKAVKALEAPQKPPHPPMATDIPPSPESDPTDPLAALRGASGERLDTLKTILPKIYRCQDKYLWPHPDGHWITLNTTQIGIQLADLGVDRQKPKGALLSDAEAVLAKIAIHNSVEAYGPLSGYDPGIVPKTNFLVTRSHLPPEPLAGDCDALRRYFHTLLPDGQWEHFFGWLKHSWHSYRDRKWTQTPVMALCGAPGAGKTLFVSVLEAVFGPQQDASTMFYGSDQFNGSLSENALLVVDDQQGQKDYASRQTMANKIKNYFFSGSVRIRRMKTDGISLRPWWRLILLLNAREEDLRVLPPFDGQDGIPDKITLYYAQAAELPHSPEDGFELNPATLRSQIPALLHWLDTEFETPQKFAHKRYGVKAYHHPIPLGLVSQMTPWAYLGEQLREAYENDVDGLEYGKVYLARDIYDYFERSLTQRRWNTFAKLFGSSMSIGKALAQLSERHMLIRHTMRANKVGYSREDRDWNNLRAE